MSAPVRIGDATLYTGDVLSVLATMPDESVHTAVTSPPYYALRDYGVPGQIGLEETPEQYVAKMVEIFREVRRVLRKDGAPWVREVEKVSPPIAPSSGKNGIQMGPQHSARRMIEHTQGMRDLGYDHDNPFPPARVIGEHPTCACGIAPVGGVVLDPFGGSGTTAEVALEYGRRAILIELKPEYVELAKRRLAPVAGRPMLNFAGDA